jgi:hypothetical protein
LSKTAIERLAEVDEYEVVREVQVSKLQYTMFYSLFSLNHTPTAGKPLYGSTPNAWDTKALERSIQGLTAVLLSLKKKPVIRYEKMSGMAKKLAVEVQVRDLAITSMYNIHDRYVAPYPNGIYSI